VSAIELPSSPRLLFGRWTAADLEDALLLWGDPRVTAFIHAEDRLSRAQVEARLATEIENERGHGIQYWRLRLRGTDDLVGCAGLKPRPAEPDVLELGFHLRPAFWGLGLATEAARAVVAHAFGPLKVAALFAGHHPDNTASERVLEKLGFERTGEELFPPTGLLHPAYRLEADRRPAP